MTTKRIDLAAVVDACRRAESFLVTSHAGPDGDSIGSILAMGCFLKALGKTDVTCVCHDPVPRLYAWMPGTESIVRPDAVTGAWDLVVVLDVAQRDRIGSVSELLSEGQEILVIDHHPEDDPCGTLNYANADYASTAEILIDVFDEAGLALTETAALVAYVGLTTDTGSFRYGNTDAVAHRHAARCLEAGVDASYVSSRVFDVYRMEKIVLLRRVLGRIERSECRRYAWSYLRLRDLEETGADSEDIEGLVNFVRNIEGVEIAALFRELDDRSVKASVRASAPHDAGALLKEFGGGGHAGAAGVVLADSLEGSMRRILGRIAESFGVAHRHTHLEDEVMHG